MTLQKKWDNKYVKTQGEENAFNIQEAFESVYENGDKIEYINEKVYESCTIEDPPVGGEI